MKKSTFNALIRLLEDKDPVVAEHVEAELRSLGMEGIATLEKAWEKTKDSVIQARLEQLIYEIQVSHFTEELYTWRKNGGKDLLEGWALLTEIQFPTLNIEKYKNEVNRLVNRTWLQAREQETDLEKLHALNKLLYNSEGYTGSYDQPSKPEKNYLGFLIDTKDGNSLSLSTLYAIIAEQLGISLQIVNFMGYYALRYYRQDAHFYIDAYNKGIFFTPQQVQEFLKKMKVEDKLYHYKPLSNIYVILNFIQLLITSYTQTGQMDKVELFKQLARDIDIRFDSDIDPSSLH